MNNYERIKQMTVEEIASLLDCDCCFFRDIGCEGIDCKQGAIQWLLQECE